MAERGAAGGRLLWTLTVLTAVSGVVDAVSYLGLGRVFTANMTGNVVVLGFAAAGADGFSVTATLTSIAAFLVGAACAGRLARDVRSHRRLLMTAMIVEGALTTLAAVIAFAASSVAHGAPRFVAIAALALGMGVRNATVRKLGVADVTTTVLTGTLTGLAADSPLAGGGNPHLGRRSSAVAAMLIGAFAGAWLHLHHGPAPALLTAAITIALTCAFYATPVPRRLPRR